MSKVYCQELVTTLTQEINFTQPRRYHIPAIKINIVMYGAPSGTFTLSIKNSDGDTLGSKSFTSADIKTDLSSTFDYGYIYKLLEFSSDIVLENGTYDFELSSSGYTYSEFNFIGWIKPITNSFNDRADSNLIYTNTPLDVLIYERRNKGTIK